VICVVFKDIKSENNVRRSYNFLVYPTKLVTGSDMRPLQRHYYLLPCSILNVLRGHFWSHNFNPSPIFIHETHSKNHWKFPHIHLTHAYDLIEPFLTAWNTGYRFGNKKGRNRRKTRLFTNPPPSPRPINMALSGKDLQVLFGFRSFCNRDVPHLNNPAGLRIKSSFKVIKLAILQYHPLSLPAW